MAPSLGPAQYRPVGRVIYNIARPPTFLLIRSVEGGCGGVQAGLKRHKNKMGSRYIELFVSSKGDMLQAIQQHGYYADQPEPPLLGTVARPGQPGGHIAARQSASYSRGPPDVREGSNTLRLRGLPYSAGVEEITEFFSGLLLFSLRPKLVVLHQICHMGRA